MVRRRKTRRSSRKKVFSVSAIELGTALSLAQSSGAANAIQTAMSGDLAGALNSLESSVMSNKTRIIGTLGAAFVAKALTKGFASGRLAKLGPIAVRA
tara:strand:- start:181 stop:474 length:294 start_codon:yes stop_codon:yes gene_type:complete